MALFYFLLGICIVAIVLLIRLRILNRRSL